MSKTVGSNPSIYVSDRGNHRILRLGDMTGKIGSELGTKGSGNNQFNQPTGIFVDSANRIYIADMGNDRIVRVDDITGKGWTAFGTKGNGNNQFNQPTGIFVDSANRIYIADMDNHRLVRLDDMTGKGWTTFGTKGSVKKNDDATFKFQRPTGLFVDSLNQIYVADLDNNRIVRVN